jgi:hypothetical protein
MPANGSEPSLTPEHHRAATSWVIMRSPRSEWVVALMSRWYEITGRLQHPACRVPLANVGTGSFFQDLVTGRWRRFGPVALPDPAIT